MHSRINYKVMKLRECALLFNSNRCLKICFMGKSENVILRTVLYGCEILCHINLTQRYEGLILLRPVACLDKPDILSKFSE
jgi:hypothetical protein